MPTIDELDPALAAADTDVLPASQGGVLRRLTRAQLVAGLQPEIAAPAGTLLGRANGGIGGPEPIALGAGLSLAGGTLSAPVPASLPGANLSAAVATAAGTATQRSLADLLADAVGPESFGAVGDGIVDDTAALSAAIGSGRPVRLGPRTYRVNGQWTIAQPNTVLLGTPGMTVLKRGAQGGGAWISVQAPGFRADGIVFDANRGQVAVESWGVLLTEACTESDIHRCAFRNAAGATLGSGLTILATAPEVLARHAIRNCEFSGNAAHGLWVQGTAGVQVEACRAWNNAAYGLNIDFNDATHARRARLVQVLGNRCWANRRGIAVGNFNEPNTEPPVWGNAMPDALAVLVAGNTCHDNTHYGLAVAGRALLVQGNLLADNGTLANMGAGLLAHVAASRVAGNSVTGSALFGIDCGGSIDSDIGGNQVLGHGYGINCGGSRNLRVDGNILAEFAYWGICAANVETDALGQNFGIACDLLAITGNRIALSGGAEGIWLRDGPSRVLVQGNDFTGRSAAHCLRADTDSVTIRGNRHDLAARIFANPILFEGRQTVVAPDIADAVMLTDVPAGVQSILGSTQAAWAGRISFVRVTNGGSGYSAATVAIGGSGSGAAAVPVLHNGQVIGIMVTAHGSGYGPVGTAVPVTITGNGSGAAATAYAAPPLPEERRLRIRCNTEVTFARTGSHPLQENWTRGALTIATDGEVEWTATWGTWRASRVTGLA